MLIIAIFAASTFAAGSARAEPPEVERLISQGVELRKARKDQEALEKFRKAHEMSGSPWALAQQALAEQALGKWLEAEEHLDVALKAKTHPWIQKQLSKLQTSIIEIGGHIGTIEITGNVQGSEVRVNGTLKGTIPLSSPIKVVSGTVVIEVSSPAHWPISRTLVAPGGGFLRENFELAAKPTPVATLPLPRAEDRTTQPTTTPISTPVAATTAAPEPSSSMRYLPWAAVGTGAAVAGIGVFLRLGAAGAVRDLESGFHDRDQATSLLDRSKTWGAAGLGCLISGAVIAAAGGALFAFDQE